uniref:CSON012310 protein n=1 Tax=Culicoides sonorensis TaxID=179676 RepID=A0A336M5U1_CULSO
MSQSSSPNLTGRGTNTNESNNSQTINILISTTTGTQFDVSVESLNTVEHLKKVISKKLKVNKDKIVLLFKERELQDGTLKDNGIIEGSKIVLTPNVETGLLTQKAENTVMQALESLNDSQVNDFLSGKSPLNLSVRLGDHMMLIQLQLSTINPSSVPTSSNTSVVTNSQMSQSNNKMPSQIQNPVAGTSKATNSASLKSSSSRSNKNVLELVPEGSSSTRIFYENNQQKFESYNNQNKSTRSPTDNFEHTDLNSYLIKDVDNLESIVKSLSNLIDEEAKQARLSESDSVLEQSPIKSLSNLVSNSISETPKQQAAVPTILPPTPSTSGNSSIASSPTMNCPDQLDPNLFHSITSCLCKRLDTNGTNNSCFSHQTASSSSSSSTSPMSSGYGSTSSMTSNTFKSNPSTPSFLHKTSHNPIVKSKSRHGSFKKHHSTNTIIAFNDNNQTPHLPHHHHHHHSTSSSSNPALNSSANGLETVEDDILEPIAGTMDNPALAEASRNLTQTLRKLSKKVFPRGDGSRRITSGAVIESMKHHGKGIYSGTFSGTLNPALQDKNGRPKRDISTIIHILNDLLSAAPQCTRSGAKIYFEPTTASTGNSIGINNGSQSAPASPSSSSSSQRRSLNQINEIPCSRCPPSNNKLMRCNEDYSGTIKSTSHRRRTSGSTSSSSTSSTSSSSSSSCHHHHHHHHHHHSMHHSHESQSISKVPSTLELENSKTKYKLDQLRLVMQQKKEHRLARKQKNLPYPTNRVPITNLSPTTTTTITAVAQPPAASPNANVESIIEEVDTVA